MKDEQMDDLIRSANEKLREDEPNGMFEGEFDDVGEDADPALDADEETETLKATPLIKQDDGNYMGNLSSAMHISIQISGGHKCGKVGAAQHFIESIIERFGDDRPIQIDYVVGDTTMHSKKYNQTVTASRAYAPILNVEISEES